MKFEFGNFNVPPTARQEVMPYRQFVEETVIQGSAYMGMQSIVRILRGDLRLQRDPQEDVRLLEARRAQLSTYGEWMIIASKIPRLRRLVGQGLITPETAVDALEIFEENVLRFGSVATEDRELNGEIYQKKGERTDWGRGYARRVVAHMAKTEKWIPRELHPVIQALHNSPIDLFR